MKIGVTIPNNFGVEPVDTLVDIAVRAEELGFDSVWTGEHLIHTDYVTSRLGTRPYYHALSVLSFVAARTTRVSLGTSVIAMPFHQPLNLAKYLATLDQLSRGRVILGAGTGYAPEEFVALNIPYEERGTRTDNSLAIITALWTEQSANYSGKHWSISDIRTYPKPYGNRPCPIWIGGMTGPAKRRAARIGDGWQPTGLTPDQLQEGVREIRELLEAEGRNYEGYEICMRLNVEIEGEYYNDLERLSMVSGNDMARLGDTVRAYKDAGATHLILCMNSSNRKAIDDAMNSISQELGIA